MKLSEAIRLGAMLKPQGFGDDATERHATESCALGAAYDAASVEPRAWHALLRAFPLADVISARHCPECQMWFWSVIPHLNDDHRWTREQTADWVETVERAQEAHHERRPVDRESVA